jgi:hypothetical protein
MWARENCYDTFNQPHWHFPIDPEPQAFLGNSSSSSLSALVLNKEQKWKYLDPSTSHQFQKIICLSYPLITKRSQGFD